MFLSEKQNVLTRAEVIRHARSAGVRFIACNMVLGVMGITREKWIDIDETAAGATFAEVAKQGRNTLFI